MINLEKTVFICFKCKKEQHICLFSTYRFQNAPFPLRLFSCFSNTCILLMDFSCTPIRVIKIPSFLFTIVTNDNLIKQALFKSSPI
ncbi:hypothetical protein CW304_17020 [Bacillus sp. UFRGS-B20]|nr:hypothetical protein CW304_17020 [Bacillus sp. UFRGS-B20]